jgi:hypothetical protein
LILGSETILDEISSQPTIVGTAVGGTGGDAVVPSAAVGADVGLSAASVDVLAHLDPVVPVAGNEPVRSFVAVESVVAVTADQRVRAEPSGQEVGGQPELRPDPRTIYVVASPPRCGRGRRVWGDSRALTIRQTSISAPPPQGDTRRSIGIDQLL